ncbi:MAG: ATP-binding cassette domain-containing protein [Cellvibrionaceae bacterium]
MALLDVKHLNVTFSTLDGDVGAVTDLNFSIEPGKTLGIVGESGSGKTQSVLSMMGLLADNATVTGSIDFNGQNLLTLKTATLNKIRGKQIAMIFQDPMTSLNPYMRISSQMAEVLTLHEGLSKKDAKKRALDMLDLVKIPDAKNRLERYPHEFSGGMRQRVAIAMALLCKPQLLIADEPTTALDVTVQAQILQLFNEIKEEFNSSIIMITHDLGVVASVCDEVLVMYAGEAMEHGSLDDIFYRPHHPYTKGLLHSVPRPDQSHDEPLYSIPGNPPNLVNKKPGCPFAERCEYVQTICNESSPPLVQVASGHLKACHREDIA